jgi:hypothetical protein
MTEIKKLRRLAIMTLVASPIICRGIASGINLITHKTPTPDTTETLAVATHNAHVKKIDNQMATFDEMATQSQIEINKHETQIALTETPTQTPTVIMTPNP